MNKILLAFLLAVLSSGAGAAQQTENPAPATLAFTGVTVIDMTGAPAKPGMTVVVTGERITALDRDGKVRIPKDARVVEAQGKFLIPGLWDMHVHAWDKDLFFGLFLANGITGVRDMGGVLEPWKKWQSEIAAGTLTGPRAHVGGVILDGIPPPRGRDAFFTNIASETQGRELVKTLKGRGADFIKVYSWLTRENYFAIVDEAKRQNMPFAGHVPFAISVAEASDAGQRSIEHLYGVALDCSGREAELRQTVVSQKGQPNGWQAYEAATTTPIDSFDAAKAQKLFARLRKNSTYVVPTLVANRHRAFLDDPKFTEDARTKYFPAYLKFLLRPETKITPAEIANAKKRLRFELSLVGKMNATGVPLLAGSDAPNPYTYSGFSLHDELGLLVEAGLTPMQALQTATRNPAQFLNQLDMIGTIERGKIANLVLLDANPLTDISNTRRINAVIVNGKLLPKEALQKMLADTEALAGKR